VEEYTNRFLTYGKAYGMIIWTGRGYLVAVVVFIASLLMEMVTEAATGNDEFYQQHPLAFPSALLLAAGIIFAINRLAVASDSGRHTLFFIPMKWWPIIIAALAVIASIYRLAS
jgi:hypothetical protein